MPSNVGFLRVNNQERDDEGFLQGLSTNQKIALASTAFSRTMLGNDGFQEAIALADKMAGAKKAKVQREATLGMLQGLAAGRGLEELLPQYGANLNVDDVKGLLNQKISEQTKLADEKRAREEEIWRNGEALKQEGLMKIAEKKRNDALAADKAGAVGAVREVIAKSGKPIGTVPQSPEVGPTKAAAAAMPSAQGAAPAAVEPQAANPLADIVGNAGYLGVLESLQNRSANAREGLAPVAGDKVISKPVTLGDITPGMLPEQYRPHMLDAIDFESKLASAESVRTGREAASEARVKKLENDLTISNMNNDIKEKQLELQTLLAESKVATDTASRGLMEDKAKSLEAEIGALKALAALRAAQAEKTEVETGDLEGKSDDLAPIFKSLRANQFNLAAGGMATPEQRLELAKWFLKNNTPADIQQRILDRLGANGTFRPKSGLDPDADIQP